MTPISCNQYTSRDVPGHLTLLGTARTNATVTLWTDGAASLPGAPDDPAGFFPTTRKGEYFAGELAVSNTGAPLWLTVTNQSVLNNGANADIVKTIGVTS